VTKSFVAFQKKLIRPMRNKYRH